MDNKDLFYKVYGANSFNDRKLSMLEQRIILTSCQFFILEQKTADVDSM